MRVLYPPSPPPVDIAEKDFQQLVVDLATVCHWTHYHTHDARKSDPGWPDLVLARECWPQRARIIFVELKRSAGRLSREQARWGELLIKGGLDWRVWRPGDWESIVETLTLVEG